MMKDFVLLILIETNTSYFEIAPSKLSQQLCVIAPSNIDYQNTNKILSTINTAKANNILIALFNMVFRSTPL